VSVVHVPRFARPYKIVIFYIVRTWLSNKIVVLCVRCTCSSLCHKVVIFCVSCTCSSLR